MTTRLIRAMLRWFRRGSPPYEDAYVAALTVLRQAHPGARAMLDGHAQDANDLLDYADWSDCMEMVYLIGAAASGHADAQRRANDWCMSVASRVAETVASDGRR